MPAFLFLSSLAALVLSIGAICFVPGLIAFERLIAGESHTLSQLRGDAEFQVGLAGLLGFGAWCYAYRWALVRHYRWFRVFSLGSLGLLFCVLAAGALSHGASLINVAEGFMIFVGVPGWYLYRKRNVVAYFEMLNSGGFGAAA